MTVWSMWKTGTADLFMKTCYVVLQSTECSSPHRPRSATVHAPGCLLLSLPCSNLAQPCLVSGMAGTMLLTQFPYSWPVQ